MDSVSDNVGVRSLVRPAQASQGGEYEEAFQ
jgi:hypothetical protein